MKQITLNIETCGDCPYLSDKCALETDGKNQYWGTAYNCSKTEERVNKNTMHEDCPLPDKSDKLPLAISIMEQALAELDRNNRKGNYVYLATEHNDMTTAILQAWDAVKRELI